MDKMRIPPGDETMYRRAMMARLSQGSISVTLVALVLAAGAGCRRAPVRLDRVLTSVSQIRNLPQSQVYAGAEAHLRGVVTYAQASDDTCFLQDDTGGIRIRLRRGKMVAESGKVMEVWGTVISSGPAPVLAESRLELSGAAPWPAAEDLESALAHARHGIYQRVSVAGVVQTSQDAYNDVTTLIMRTGSGPLKVKALAPAFSDGGSLIDAELRIEGVLAGTPGTGSADSILVAAPALTAAVVTRPAPPPAAAPKVTAAGLLRLGPDHLPGHRVRLTGQLQAAAAGGFELTDATGRILAIPAEAGLQPRNGKDAIAGFAFWQNGRVILRDVVDAAAVPETARVLPVESSARAVHRLSSSAAARRYPVKLRGVVTYSDPFNGILFIDDGTDGMFVSLDDPADGLLRPRDRVEITGETTPGDFAPSVTRAHFRILGRASLPAPAAGGFESAFQGQRDCRWVELSGVMQSAAPGSHEAVAQMVYGVHRFQARILAPVEVLQRFVNADVKLRGVCGAIFNDRRQMLGIVLYVPGTDYMEVERAAPADLFALPLQSVVNLLQFSPGAALGHRVRLRGIVTATEPSGTVWIQDSTGAIGIRDHGEEPVAVGDLDDVVGFPAPGAYSPILTNAKIRRVGAAKAPVPVRVTVTQLLDGGHDGQLVEAEGVLVDRMFSADGLVLLLKSGHNQFTASLQARNVRMPEPGALLRIAGICSTLVDDSREAVAPRSFEIRMRSPQDLVILKQPSWLTFERLLPLFLVTLAVAAVAVFWASRLRRRLQSQANVLVQKTAQLEKEHHQATRALRRAQEAEVMEQAHKNVLELVARDEDLNGVLLQLAQAVEEHCPGVACAIQLRLPGGQRMGAASSLPRDWQQALASIEIEEFAAAGAHPLAELSRADAWRPVAEAPHSRMQRVNVTPIERDSRIIGAVLAFPAGEIVLRRAQLDFLTSASRLAALAVGRRVLYDQLSHQARHDDLTGLENRAALMARLAREIGMAAAAGRLLGVIYIDLDNFKHINDTLGHAAGDVVLREVARRMQTGVRCSDTLARLGGDEFVVVLPNLGHRADGQRIAAQLVDSLSQPIPFSGQMLVVGASAGAAIYPLDGNDPDALLTAADHRMYREKSFRHYTGPADPATPSSESQLVS